MDEHLALEKKLLPTEGGFRMATEPSKYSHWLPVGHFLFAKTDPKPR